MDLELHLHRWRPLRWWRRRNLLCDIWGSLVKGLKPGLAAGESYRGLLALIAGLDGLARLDWDAFPPVSVFLV